MNNNDLKWNPDELAKHFTSLSWFRRLLIRFWLWAVDFYFTWHNDYDPETSITVVVTPDVGNSFEMTRTKETSISQTMAVSRFIAEYFVSWMNGKLETAQILITYRRAPQ